MSTKKNLYIVSQVVKEVLEDYEQTRNDDSLLYLKVLEVIGSREGVDVDNLTVSTFLLNVNVLKLPKFETVARARRKIQAEYPELSANSYVTEKREMNERVFKEYALSKGV